MLRNIRAGFRGLALQPAATAAAILTLGLAIGAQATILSVVDGLWFRPPGVPAASRLLRVFAVSENEQHGRWSYPEVLDLQRAVASSQLVVRGSRGTLVEDPSGTPALALVNVVSDDFFQALGASAAHGRLFVAPETAPVVVLGHKYWQTRFGGDPAVVGRTLRLGGTGEVAVTIQGVLAASFRDLEAANDRDVWMPQATWVQLAGRREFDDRKSRWLEAFAVRRAGVSVSLASTEILQAVNNMEQAHPEPTGARRTRVVSESTYRFETGGANAIALLALVGAVVLITCVNVALLQVARVMARQQDLAVCVALGATRRKLLGPLLAEAAWMGAGGAVVGLLSGTALIRTIPRILTPAPGFRDFMLITLDGRVVVATLGVAIITTILFTLGPAWITLRSDFVGITGRGATELHRRSRGHLLVVTQVACAFVLLAAAGVLARSLWAAREGDFGLTRRPVLTAWVPTELSRTMGDAALLRLRALPGVADVAVAIRAPLSLSGGGRARAMWIPETRDASEDDLPVIKGNAVSANYFALMGTRIVSGRPFAEDELHGTGAPAVVVNEAFAQRYFRGRGAVGAIVHPGGADQPAHRVVGVAQDAAVSGIGEPAEPYFYESFWDTPAGETTFLILPSLGAVVQPATVREALMEVDPQLEPRRMVAMDDYFRYATREYRAMAVLAFALGVLGLLLSMTGVYGVMAYRTAQRSREWAIRAALGAMRRQLVQTVLAEGAGIAAVGIGLGLILALWTNHWLGSLLLGVHPWDPASLLVAAAGVAAAILLATLVPAWRAARVNPNLALRDA